MPGLRERGQGLVEYGLVLVLIAVLAVTALGLLGGTINHMLSHVGAVL